MIKKALLLMMFCFSVQGAIYDCFLFFNEDELLRIHLEELYDHVDCFVIVEAEETFSGKAKELRFPKIKDSYAKFLNKIIYVPVTERIAGDNPWPREEFQRNQIMRGLKNCRNSDLIIIGDLDEIVKSARLQPLIAELFKGRSQVIGCEADFYRWFFNRKDLTPWVGSALTTYGFLKYRTADVIRGMRHQHTLKDSSWHFSNMGGFALFIDKLRSFSHFKECNPDEVEKDPGKLYFSLNAFELTEIDATFPKFIQENKAYYIEKGFIDSGNGFVN